MADENKVYCRDCRYADLGFNDVCMLDPITNTYHTAIQPVLDVYYSKCETKNKNNDCNSFEKLDKPSVIEDKYDISSALKKVKDWIKF